MDWARTPVEFFLSQQHRTPLCCVGGSSAQQKNSVMTCRMRLDNIAFNVLNWLVPGKCKVHSDRLTTFDGMPLLLPERPTGICHVVLAHDCSERKLFSIGGTLVDGKWIVKVLIPEYHISLHPDRSVSSEYTVKVNGNDVTRPRRSSPVLLYSDDRWVHYLLHSYSIIHNFEIFDIRPSIEIYIRPSLYIVNSSVWRSQLLVTIKKTSEGLKVKLHELKLTLDLKDGEKITLKV